MKDLAPVRDVAHR